jgi:hypothetical protein
MDLATAKAEHFEPLQGDLFTANDRDLSLQLVGVTQLTSAETKPERQPFSLTFKGRCRDVPAQGLYQLEHPTIGELGIFLVPVGMEGEEYLFEAVFN